jgi:hypothetical protein
MLQQRGICGDITPDLPPPKPSARNFDQPFHQLYPRMVRATSMDDGTQAPDNTRRSSELVRERGDLLIQTCNHTSRPCWIKINPRHPDTTRKSIFSLLCKHTPRHYTGSSRSPIFPYCHHNPRQGATNKIIEQRSIHRHFTKGGIGTVYGIAKEGTTEPLV